MAMSQEHRKRLISNRVALVRDIQLGEELFSHLMATGIITRDNKELIESLPTRQDKVDRLLDIIPTRGAKAFPELIHAFVLTQQAHIAGILDRDLTQRYRDQEECGSNPTEEVDSSAATAPVSKKSVDDKVSEIPFSGGDATEKEQLRRQQQKELLKFLRSKDWAKQYYRDISTDVVHIAVEDRKKAEECLQERNFPDQLYKIVDPWQSSYDPSVELSPGRTLYGTEEEEDTVSRFLLSGSVKNRVRERELGITVEHAVSRDEDIQVVDDKTRTTVGKCREAYWCIEDEEGNPLTADLALLEMNYEVCSVRNTVQLLCGDRVKKTFPLKIHRGEIPAEEKPPEVIILDKNEHLQYGRIYKDELTDRNVGLYRVLEIADESSAAAVTKNGDSGALVMSVLNSESDAVSVYGTVIGKYIPETGSQTSKTVANLLSEVIGEISKIEHSQLSGDVDDIDFA